MNWQDFQQVARVRAVEETDAQGRVWDAATRRTATEHAARGSARQGAGSFLARRAARLVQDTNEPLAEKLRLPVVPGWLATSGLLVAFAVGWTLSAVGQEREINLLALPLVGILAWNAVVILLSLLAWLKPGTSRGLGGTVESFLRRMAVWRTRDEGTVGGKIPADAPARFASLSTEAWRSRLGARFRAWLHLGAALIALGSTAGMLARGWSRDYRAVWESTLLDASGASRFLGALFAPASQVTGLPIALEKIPGMQRVGGGEASDRDSARNWIYLYSATLGLLVVAPRLLLMLLELMQARRSASLAMQSADWQSHARKLMALVEGAGAPAQILTHGLAVDDLSQERWRQWVTTVWRDVGRAEFVSVPVAGETEFLAAWEPSAPRVALVFNMANVPEAEVQLEVAQGIARKLQARSMGGIPLVLALDDTDLRRRWSGFAEGENRLAERLAVWREVLKDVPAEWVERSGATTAR